MSARASFAVGSDDFDFAVRLGRARKCDNTRGKDSVVVRDEYAHAKFYYEVGLPGSAGLVRMGLTVVFLVLAVAFWRLAGTPRSGILAAIYACSFLAIRYGTAKVDGVGHSAEVQVPLVGIGLAILAMLVWLAVRWGEGKTATLFMVTLPLTLLSGEAGSAGGWGSWLSQFGLTPEMIEPTIWVIRKFVHVTFYGALTWLGMRALAGQESVNARKLWLGAAGWAVSFALFDETRQMFSPGRSGSIEDVGIDLFGIVLFGSWFYARWRREKAQC